MSTFSAYTPAKSGGMALNTSSSRYVYFINNTNITPAWARSGDDCPAYSINNAYNHGSNKPYIKVTTDVQAYQGGVIIERSTDNGVPLNNMFRLGSPEFTSNYTFISYILPPTTLRAGNSSICFSYIKYQNTNYETYYAAYNEVYIDVYELEKSTMEDKTESIEVAAGKTITKTFTSAYTNLGTPSSNNTSIATVTKSGNKLTIQGVAAGSTKITCVRKAKSGSYKYGITSSGGGTSTLGTVTLNVNVTKGTGTIGTISDYNKTYGDANFTISPILTYVASLSWSLSNSTVVSIASTGTNNKSATFKILKPGEVTVTVSGTARSGYSKPSNKTFKIKVSKNSSGFTPSSYSKTVNGVDYPSLHFTYTVQSNNSIFVWLEGGNNYITSNSSTCYINRPPTPQTITAILQRASDEYYESKALSISVTFERKTPNFHAYTSLYESLTLPYGSTYAITGNSTPIDTGGLYNITSDKATKVSASGSTVTIKATSLGTGTIRVWRDKGTWWNEAYAYSSFPITVTKGNTTVSLNKTSVTLWINHPTNPASTTVTPTISGSSGTAYWIASNANITVSGNRTSGTITASNYGTSSVSFYVQGNDYYNASETKTVSVSVYRYYLINLIASINDRIIPKYYYVYATSSTIKVRLTVLDGAAAVMTLLSSSIQTSNGVVTNITSTIIDNTTIDYTIVVNTSSNSYDEIELGLLTAKYSGYQYFVAKTITLYITRITLPTSKRIVTNNYLDILYNTTVPGDPNYPVSTDWCPTKSAIFDNIVGSNKYGRLIFNVIGTFANNQLIPQNSLYVVGCETDIYLKNNHIVPNIEYEDINLTRKFNIVITSNTTQYFYYGDPAVLSIDYEVLLENSNTRVNVPMDIRVNYTPTYTLTEVSPGKGNVSLTLQPGVNSSDYFTLIPKYNYINSYTDTEYYLEYDNGICNYGDEKTVTVNSVYQKRPVSTTVYISSSSQGTSISSSLSKEATTSFTLYARVKENNTSSYLSISTSDLGVEFTTAYGSITNITSQSSNEIKFTVNLNSNTGSPKVAVNFKGKSNSTINYKTSSKEVTINVTEKTTVAPMPEVYYVTCSNTNYSAANGNYITIYPTFKLYNPNNNIITTYIPGITVSSSTPPSLGNWSISMDSNFSSTGKYTVSGTFAVIGNSYIDIYLTIPSGNSSYYATIPVTISGY